MGVTPQSYLYNADNGVPGDITRTDETNVEPAMLIASGSPAVFAQAFGIPMAYATGGITQFQSTNAAADFAGVLVREVPGISGNFNQGLLDTTPYPAVPQGLAVRGYVSVVCKYGTPARGGVVYVQITAHSGAIPGDFRADGTDSGNAVALTATQAEWATDGKDSNNNAELRIAR